MIDASGRVTKLFTNVNNLSSELIDVAKLFIREGTFEFCGDVSDADICHIFNQENDVIKNVCTFCDVEYGNSFTLPSECDGIEKKRLIKRYAKLCVYFCLVKKFNLHMPWGALTGIRPTKLAWELTKQGEDFKKVFKNTFDVSDKKIALVESILTVQKDFRTYADDLVDIYVGIPFCASRCSYCSFTGGEITKMQKYVVPYYETLRKEITETLNIVRDNGLTVKNVYFGGGTPTALPLEYLEGLIELFDNVSKREFTIEAGRPDTISAETFKVFDAHGVNRISINPQTFSQRILDLVGRKHSVQDIFDTYYLARKHSFVINMDFIAGLPTQTVEEFKQDIDTVCGLKPDNVTVHTLALKKGTAIKEQANQVAYDGSVSDMVDYAYSTLSEIDYQPYYMYRQKYMADNVENIGYCQPGKPSLYNIDIMEETTGILACGSNSISKRIFSDENRIERLAAQKDLPTYIGGIDETIEKKKKLFDFTSTKK